jgi:archaemetzincin
MEPAGDGGDARSREVVKTISLLTVGKVDNALLEHLQQALQEQFGTPCSLLSLHLDPEFAFHAERQQYHSSEILARMQNCLTGDTWRLLGVTGVDLYIPILTFVFGEAQMGGSCALLSLHRLRQEFYGLASDRDILYQRVLKEAVHELGHTLNLTHCDDYQCAMAPSHAVEWIDLKERSLCTACQSRILSRQTA